jgi:hypothetical protein
VGNRKSGSSQSVSEEAVKFHEILILFYTCVTVFLVGYNHEASKNRHNEVIRRLDAIELRCVK